MNEFERRIKEIFTGSVAYDEYRGFIEANLAEILKECREEFPWRHILDDLIEGKGYWSEHDIRVVASWFKEWLGDK